MYAEMYTIIERGEEKIDQFWKVYEKKWLYNAFEMKPLADASCHDLALKYQFQLLLTKF